jgi:hypothetical protein
VSAEKAAAEAKDAAKREAELIVAEAHGESRSIVRAAQSERERLFGEARRIEALLRAALGIVAEGAGGGAAPAPAEASGGDTPPAAPPAPEHWPRREDTREFQVVRGDAPAAEPQPAAEQQPPAEPEPAAQEQPAQLPPETMPEQPAPREFAWGD